MIIDPSAFTHADDGNEALVPLEIVQSLTGLTVTVPNDLSVHEQGVSVEQLPGIIQRALAKYERKTRKSDVARMKLISATERIHGAAFSSHGSETRAVIVNATSSLSVALTEFQIAMGQLLQDRFLQPHVDAIQDVWTYCRDLYRYSLAYIKYEPISGSLDYHSQRRYARKSLADLREFIRENNSRFQRLFTEHEQVRDNRGLRPNDVKRYIGDLAREYAEPDRGKTWQIGVLIYERLRGIGRRSSSSTQRTPNLYT